MATLLEIAKEKLERKDYLTPFCLDFLAKRGDENIRKLVEVHPNTSQDTLKYLKNLNKMKVEK